MFVCLTAVHEVLSHTEQAPDLIQRFRFECETWMELRDVTNLSPDIRQSHLVLDVVLGFDETI